MYRSGFEPMVQILLPFGASLDADDIFPDLVHE